MTPADLLIRPAGSADLPVLHALVERAYRGDSARLGWTHEADLLDGQRTSATTLAATLDDARERILVLERCGAIIGSVQISERTPGTSCLGLLAVEPGLQARGLGKRLIEAAEAEAAVQFGAETMELTVIGQRVELIEYYERRGYSPTGELRPFPIPVIPPLELLVMSKALASPEP